MRWIIGDVHGMLRPLEMLLREIAKADAAAELIFVGDYVNRGPDSRKVIDLLLTLPNASFIRGNHDDIVDEILHGASYAQNASEGKPLAAFQWFMQHGLASTLESYGADWAELDFILKRPNWERLTKVLECIPETHRQFIRNLPAIVEGDDFFVAHGKWDVSDSDKTPSLTEQLALEPIKRHKLLWGRYTDDEITVVKSWERTGYFGHTPVDAYPGLLGNNGLVPISGSRIVLLDTAAALTPEGRLSAVCHDSQQLIQVDRFGKLVEEKPRHKWPFFFR
jgi:serine/threonine protein phosphatase 1